MERLILPATDDYPLFVYCYHASGHIHGNLLVAGVTGVAQCFYWRFAERTTRQGLDVFTLDYRDIDEFAPVSLKGSAMSYLGWAYRDLAAVVELFSREERPLYQIDHSFGGHVIGLLLDHGRLAACYSFDSGAGWSGWISRHEVLKVRLPRTPVLLPLVAWKGYMTRGLLGMGDDLPLGVYRDWKRWCRHPCYYSDDPAMCRFHQRYVTVRMPCLFAITLGGPWAPLRSRDAFVETCRNTPLETLNLRPDGGPLGHIGYFHAGIETLWDDALRWLGRHPKNA